VETTSRWRSTWSDPRPPPRYEITVDLRREQVERRLYRTMRSTCEAYQLLTPGDRVMVAMSGGKDSYVLFHLLTRLVPRLPFSVELVAVHLDQAQPGYDGAPLRDFLAASGWPYEILREDTYSVVIERTEPGATYCTVCSRLRRGILYTAAERLGCTKIALGHHREDTLETFLLNLVYAGKLQAMPATYRTNDDRFDVIRPLIECDEAIIAELAQALAFPILPCNLCGSQDGLRRDVMGKLLDQLEKDSPNVRAVMASALANVRPTHLLDRDLQAVWKAHGPAEPDAAPARPRRSLAEAVESGGPELSDRGGRLSLPIVSER
jgi:tRNA 2-thiocytidine biosynthesis protein TtcA